MRPFLLLVLSVLLLGITTPAHPTGLGHDRHTAEYLVRVRDASSNRIQPTPAARIARMSRWLWAEGLWTNTSMWWLSSQDNAGAGTTVHTFGGWVTTPATLVNGPTWDTDQNGIFFDGVNDFVQLPAETRVGSVGVGYLTLGGSFRPSATTGIGQVLFIPTGNTNLVQTRALMGRNTTSGYIGGRRLDSDSFATVSSGAVTNLAFSRAVATFAYAVGEVRHVWNGTHYSAAFQTAGVTSSSTNRLDSIGATPVGGEPFRGRIRAALINTGSDFTTNQRAQLETLLP
jgi:hypothetical protein